MHPEPEAQRKAAGITLSAKRGDAKKGDLQGGTRDMYDPMFESDLEKMTATPRKGKPEHDSD